MSTPKDLIAEPLMVIDHVIATCHTCRVARHFELTQPLRGADQLIAWMSIGLTPCPCGGRMGDIAAHIANEGELN
jgi:hypothetical protein